MSVVRYALCMMSLAMSVSLAYGDEGMWLFNDLPHNNAAGKSMGFEAAKERWA